MKRCGYAKNEMIKRSEPFSGLNSIGRKEEIKKERKKERKLNKKKSRK
jgi:hypothetical protein